MKEEEKRRSGVLGGLAESSIKPITFSVVFNPDALYLSSKDRVMGYH